MAFSTETSIVPSELYQTLKSHTSDVNCLDFNGKVLATGSGDKIIRLFYLEQKEEEFYFFHHHSLKFHQYSVTSISFATYGNLLGSGSHDGRIAIWKIVGIEEPIILHTLIGPSNLKAFIFGPFDNQCCATGDGNEVVLWQGIGNDELVSQRTFSMRDVVTITTAVFSPKGTFLIACSSDAKISAWRCTDFQTCILLEINNAHDVGITASDIICASNQDSGFLFATAGHDDLVKVWNIFYEENFRMTHSRTCKGHRNSVYSVKFRADAKILVSTGNDHKIMVWDPAHGVLVHSFEAHARAGVTCCYVDHLFLATGSIDKLVCIWKLYIPGFFAGEKIKPSLKPKKLLEWSVLEVTQWIRELGYPQYADNFRNHDISGRELLHMTMEGLNHGVGIKIFGHCMRILKEVHYLKNPFLSRYSEDFTSDNLWPPEFLCPITKQLMKEPVVLEDGTSYERDAIENWMSGGNFTSPTTNQVLSCLDYFPNLNLMSLMKKFQT